MRRPTQLSHQHQLQNPEPNSDEQRVFKRQKKDPAAFPSRMFSEPRPRVLDVLFTVPGVGTSSSALFTTTGVFQLFELFTPRHDEIYMKYHAFGVASKSGSLFNPTFESIFFLLQAYPTCFSIIFFRSSRWLQYMACLAQWLPERCWAKRRIKTPGRVHLGQSQGFSGPFWTTNGEFHGSFHGIFATRLVDVLTTAITRRLS